MHLNPFIDATQYGMFRKIGRGWRRKTRHDIMKTMPYPERGIETKCYNATPDTGNQQLEECRSPICPSLRCIDKLVRCLCIECMLSQQYQYKSDQWSSREFDLHSQRKGNHWREIV